MNNAGVKILSSKASTRQMFTKAIMELSEIRCIEFLVYRLALYEIKRHKAAYHCRVYAEQVLNLRTCGSLCAQNQSPVRYKQINAR